MINTTGFFTAILVLIFSSCPQYSTEVKFRGPRPHRRWTTARARERNHPLPRSPLHPFRVELVIAFLHADILPMSDSAPVLRSPHLILDEAVAAAAQTVADAARGADISREQLAAAQDILNRKGVTSGAKSNPIPEAFARDAFASVFRLYGLEPIRWPSSAPSKSKKKKGASASIDDFNAALADA